MFKNLNLIQILIISGTASLKVMLFPVFLKMQRHQGLQKVYAKDLGYFERKKKEAVSDGDSMRGKRPI